MKKMTTMLLLVLLFTQCSSEPIQDTDKISKISEEILNNLTATNFEAARKDFDSTMKNVLSEEQLKTVWDGLIGQVGAYQESGKTILDTIEEYRVVYIILKFENAPLKLKVVFSDDDLVSGLFIVPVNAK
ncbi:MAG: DUF3887 domain-containing protein [Cyclobacteriaceae bacterium]